MGPEPKIPATINMVRPKVEAQAYPGTKLASLPSLPQIQNIAQGMNQYSPLNLGIRNNPNNNQLIRILSSLG